MIKLKAETKGLVRCVKCPIKNKELTIDNCIPCICFEGCMKEDSSLEYWAHMIARPDYIRCDHDNLKG